MVLGQSLPPLGSPDSAGIKANESTAKGGGALMSKIIAGIQKVIGKVTGHRYTGFTIKAPFINLSFAPVLFPRPHKGPFLLAIG